MMLRTQILAYLVLMAVSTHGQHYRVAALNFEGDAILFQRFNQTFGHYLPEAVKELLPSTDISFELVAMGEDELTAAVRARSVHFVFTNPYLATCYETEYLTRPLLTIDAINVASQLSSPYYGGVITTLKSNTHINTLADLRDKRVAAESVYSLGGSLMQAQLMQDSGYDPFDDPSVLIFTNSMDKALSHVMHNLSDVAFVRSGVLENCDALGNIDINDWKLIHPLELTVDGAAFPFLVSTALVPEWSFSALTILPMEHVHAVVSALVRIESNSTEAREGIYNAWLPSLGYMMFRNVMEGMGTFEPTAIGLKCRAMVDTYDGLNCLPDHFKRPYWEVQSGCSDSGTECPDGSECVCRPCHRGDPVEIYTTYLVAERAASEHTIADRLGNEHADQCQRLQNCATIAQLEPLAIEIIINEISSRNETSVSFDIQAAWYRNGVRETLEVSQVRSTTAEVSIMAERKAQYLIEILVDGEQIEASPFFVTVEERQCPEENQKANLYSDCMCTRGFLQLNGKCVSQGPVVAGGVAGGVILLLAAFAFAWRKQQQKNDKMWRIKRADIEFDDSRPELGRGAFGVVLLASYRGTLVAVKRNVEEARKGLAPRRFGSRTQMGTSTSRRSTTKGCQRTSLANEMRILSKIRHPCVVTIMGAVIDGQGGSMLVLEYMEHGSLCDLFQNKQMEVDGEILKPVIQDAASGLQFLHNFSKPIIHGDIKSSNVLLDSNFRGKIADLNLSASRKCAYKGGIGTPQYMAPELLQGQCFSTASDVYAFGIFLWECMARQLPYPGIDFDELLPKIRDNTNAKSMIRPVVPADCPAEVAKVMRLCWQDKAQDRPSLDVIVEQLRRMHIRKVGATMIGGMATQKEQARVLNDVFPPHIAEKLRKGEKVQPEHHDEVTIFFSDIKGFTNISAQLTPVEVSELLDRLYTRFDDLSLKHACFKVETIGDAFMAVTNLVQPQPDHAALIARFSQDAIQAAQETAICPRLPELGTVEIRVGFHTGPVVANVVGTRNPRYCLFGDTVNTASRMESNSEANRIHMSPDAAACLRAQAPEMVLEARPPMEIKGKGVMQTYFLAQQGDETRRVIDQISVV
eukprot:m.178541 g.178541  ORF g.178541 m.178541 type:complete len:1090 (+) comp16840_c0_seq1:161-3430(+)